jgi:hypothetical protein
MLSMMPSEVSSTWQLRPITTLLKNSIAKTTKRRVSSKNVIGLLDEEQLSMPLPVRYMDRILPSVQPGTSWYITYVRKSFQTKKEFSPTSTYFRLPILA